jgi:hypothetical protein
MEELVCHGCPYKEFMYEETGELSMSTCYCLKKKEVVTESCEEK